MPRWRFLLILLTLTVPALSSQNDTPKQWREFETVNPGLSETEEPPNLETPLACVEHFMLSAREGDFDAASRVLHFRLIDDVDDAAARSLAERFFYVLNQELWIDWAALPDRPDGMIDEVNLGSNSNPLIGKPRRGILLDSIEIKERAVPIRLERVKAEGADPVWLFAAQTVENIEALYDSHGPSALEQWLPAWAKQRGPGRVPLWQWGVLVLAIALAPVLGWLVARSTRKAAKNIKYVSHDLLDRIDWPLVGVISSAILLGTLKWGLTLPSAIAAFVEPVVLVALIATVTWFVMRVLNYTVEHLAHRAIRRVHEENSDEERRLLMQVTVVRHVVLLAIAIAGVGVLLIQLDLARTLGVTLLTSAGAAAVIFGIAGHALLGNLIAGLEIALAQPLKPGDTVYVEDNWGRIEDIGYTQVIVRTWDDRRLVFPIRYFTSNWFENWSLTDTFLTKPIYLKLDYRAPVDQIRDKFLELTKQDEDWDEENDEPQVLVTDLSDETMTIRCTSASPTVSGAWNMSCRLREQLVEWLQELDDGKYLPRQRVEITQDAAERRD